MAKVKNFKFCSTLVAHMKYYPQDDRLSQMGIFMVT